MTNRTLIINGNLLNTKTAKFVRGEMLFEDGIILAIGKEGELPRNRVTILDANGAYISPGLIDIHTHGRAGGDFNSADTDLLQKMSRSYLRAGVTTVTPTLASAPMDAYITAAERLAAVSQTPQGCRFWGLHLEGRYLNPSKRGAHAASLLSPLSGKELTSLIEQMRRCYGDLQLPFRVSAALELDEGDFIDAALALGIRLSLAHTEATYEQAMQIVARGAVSFTHLFNAMPPLHHRGGGAVMACFDSNAYGELICDGFHISPEMVRLAYAMLGRKRLLLISDSMEGTGCPDGKYTIAGMNVIVHDRKAYTTDGHIAGSTLDLLDGVRNLMKFCQISLAEALCCATINPARTAGIDNNVGALKPKLAADFLMLDHDGQMTDIYVGGERRTEAIL